MEQAATMLAQVQTLLRPRVTDSFTSQQKFMLWFLSYLLNDAMNHTSGHQWSPGSWRHRNEQNGHCSAPAEPTFLVRGPINKVQSGVVLCHVNTTGSTQWEGPWGVNCAQPWVCLEDSLRIRSFTAFLQGVSGMTWKLVGSSAAREAGPSIQGRLPSPPASSNSRDPCKARASFRNSVGIRRFSAEGRHRGWERHAQNLQFLQHCTNLMEKHPFTLFWAESWCVIRDGGGNETIYFWLYATLLRVFIGDFIYYGSWVSRLERFLKYLTTSKHSLCNKKKINNVKKNKWKLLIL